MINIDERRVIVILVSALLLFGGFTVLETTGESKTLSTNNENLETDNGITASSNPKIDVYISEIQKDDEIEEVGEGEADWYYWVGVSQGSGINWETSPEPIESDNDNPDVKETHTFDITNKSRNIFEIYITLLEEDTTSGDDLADISSGGAGGRDDVGEPEPPSDSYPDASFVGYWDIETNSLTDRSHKTEPYGLHRITKGMFDGNPGDENDANVVFSISDNYEPPTAQISTNSTEITTGESVSFNGSQSFASDGSSLSSYQWDFDGDGIYDDSGITTSYTYENLGTYEAELKVTDDWEKTDFDSVTITVNNRKPEAEFSYTPSNPTTKDKIQFSDGSTDTDGDIQSRSWDFGDGNSSTSEEPTHRYEDEGSYTVQLTVEDDKGATDSVSKSINVENQPPKANFTYTPSKPKTLEDVSFEDTSLDSDGNIVSREWSFDNGESSTNESPIISYQDDGTYTVDLTVTDEDGDSDTVSKDIEIENRDPEAEFDYNPENPTTGDSIEFEDVSNDLDGSIESWEWTFGNGDNSTKQSPSHQYEEAGDYAVELTVEDDDGDTDSYETTVSVEEDSDGSDSGDDGDSSDGDSSDGGNDDDSDIGGIPIFTTMLLLLLLLGVVAAIIYQIKKP